MSQCLRITFIIAGNEKSSLYRLIQKEARKLMLEGAMQKLEGEKIKVIACGPKTKMDQFLDVLHKETTLKACDDLEIEPFFKDRDYRGVFRVIE